ncbi:relaxase/mobilization nuclease domain-containing protein [Sinomicrobium weinanense]|uniref:Relaxase/mobilization nuclease domain-containing protein n=1 Tax=Sinomicrobium weinanense TaxID=2842200 RepID=A0A926JRQ3_9FLAO|nr:relaxase/mobilization nuclease domain-containing protein [Sinomicrobium weinanense]MBC9796275.1 relaxase/mobilization nuclease domain-containing protein [Sinomicrobium weinanense]MBU3123244.1 relaxase/mobilization nuclease domain-containing protein [Sinomicrobium weinanense]
MIGKGKSIAHTQASMQYGWNQEKDAEIVYTQNLCGENPKEVTKEFQMIQQMNIRCEKNTLSFVLSPTIEDGRSLSRENLEELTDTFIKEMELGERQAIAFVHRDKAHTHIHLYVNRIDFQGKAYKDNYIGKRSQKAAERTAQRLQLTTVREVQQIKDQSLKQIRSEIKQIHDNIMQQHKPKSFDQYITLMKQKQISVIPTINKQNQLQGFRFQYQSHNLKGSEVHREMSGAKLGAALSRNQRFGQKLIQNNQVNLMGKVVKLSGNMAAKITTELARQVAKRVRDTGFEIGY